MNIRLSSRSLIGIILFLLLVGLLFLWPATFYDPKPENMPSFPRAHLVIQRADGQTFPYDVEVAETPQQEAYGLMFRHSLPADRGMVFVYKSGQPLQMWMKNTFIPLDMLFIGEGGVIVKIVTHTEPLSLEHISSSGPVRGVIEINAGEADKHGFKTGDKVLFSGFSD